jgi:hypothetical protein
MFAVPLLIVPVQMLTLLGWTTVDPFATRLVAAALFGIGIESLLGRNASADAFKGMLNLKIIWSISAILGMVLSLLQGAAPAGWLFVGIFAAFSCVWIYYRVRLTGRRATNQADDSRSR